MRPTSPILASCALIALAGCLAAGPADEAMVDAAPPSAQPASVITGGYAGPVDLEDEHASAAKQLAIDTIYTRNPTRALVEDVDAELQVVAGINYRFTIVMTGGATYRVVVYRNLQGGMSVTAYDKVA